MRVCKKIMQNKNRYSEEKENSIVQFYLEGKNQAELGKQFKTSNTAIRRVLKRNNIPIISSSER